MDVRSLVKSEVDALAARPDTTIYDRFVWKKKDKIMRATTFIQWMEFIEKEYVKLAQRNPRMDSRRLADLLAFKNKRVREFKEQFDVYYIIAKRSRTASEERALATFIVNMQAVEDGTLRPEEATQLGAANLLTQGIAKSKREDMIEEVGRARDEAAEHKDRIVEDGAAATIEVDDATGKSTVHLKQTTDLAQGIREGAKNATNIERVAAQLHKAHKKRFGSLTKEHATRTHKRHTPAGKKSRAELLAERGVVDETPKVEEEGEVDDVVEEEETKTEVEPEEEVDETPKIPEGDIGSSMEARRVYLKHTKGELPRGEYNIDMRGQGPNTKYSPLVLCVIEDGDPEGVTRPLLIPTPLPGDRPSIDPAVQAALDAYDDEVRAVSSTKEYKDTMLNERGYHMRRSHVRRKKARR